MPVTLTLTDDQWHLVLRQAVYVATQLETFLTDLHRVADPRKDAWVLAASQRLKTSVAAQDTLLELLHDAEARPVPGHRR
jgi:hypothetical protein